MPTGLFRNDRTGEAITTPGLRQLAHILVATYGVTVAAEIVMALAFNQVMIGHSSYGRYLPRGAGPGEYDTYVQDHRWRIANFYALKQWQIVTIGGVLAYTFLTDVRRMGSANAVTNYGLWSGAYTLGEFALILAIITGEAVMVRPVDRKIGDRF